MQKKPKIIKKVWGHEEWIVNGKYCGKKLIVKKGYRCSMHYHKNKDEAFHLLSGKILMERNGEKKVMLPGNTIRIVSKIEHRFTGLQDSVIIEFSTHHEDKDSYRRELSGKVDLDKIYL